MPSLQSIITVDGASGTGKGVVSQRVAQQLGWHLLDSGALYRILAFAAEQKGIFLDREAELQSLAETLNVRFVTEEVYSLPQVILDDINVSQLIRSEQIGNAASKVGVLLGVRTALLGRQRDFFQPPGLVADGRDMGTVVFPEAPLKIFLVASPEERAQRRYKQLKEIGLDVNLGDLVADLRERDQRDQQRQVAPLKPAQDAVLIDTDQLTIDQVVFRIMQEAKRVFTAN